MPAKLFSWRPDRPNFGDELSQTVVDGVEWLTGAEDHYRGMGPEFSAIGSIIHLLPEGSIVWGSGVNGKDLEKSPPAHLDVRALRGELSKSYLESHGYSFSEILPLGDPAYLLPIFLGPGEERKEGTVWLHHADDPVDSYEGSFDRVLSPWEPPSIILSAIYSSSLVVSSSLHGLIVADAYGIPFKPVLPQLEPRWKFDDWWSVLGRGELDFGTIYEPTSRVTVSSIRERLLESFPTEVFSQ